MGAWAQNGRRDRLAEKTRFQRARPVELAVGVSGSEWHRVAGERTGRCCCCCLHQVKHGKRRPVTEGRYARGPVEQGVPTACCHLLRSNCHKLQDLPEATWNNNKTMRHARLEDVEARGANHVRLCAPAVSSYPASNSVGPFLHFPELSFSLVNDVQCRHASEVKLQKDRFPSSQ